MPKVLAAIDGSEHATHALRAAVGLFGTDAEWVLFSVVPPWTPTTAVTEDLDASADSDGDTGDDDPETDALLDYYRTAQEQAARAAGITAEHAIDEARPQKRHIGHAICAGADAHDADVIVIGSHGSSHTGEVLLGSVGQYVLHHTTRPVLVVRQH